MSRHLIQSDIDDNSSSSSKVWSSQKTQEYIDNLLAKVAAKESVRAATTGNITLSGTQTIDAVALSVGDRVLVKNQTTASENGLYTVAAGAWSRSSDANSAEKLKSAFVFVDEGTVNADVSFLCVTDDIVLNTTGLVFSQFGVSVDLSAYALKVGATDIEITDDTKGVILSSPDNTRWRVTVGNDGALVTTSI